VAPPWRAAVVRPMSGDALELVGVRAQSVRPPPSVGITMRGCGIGSRGRLLGRLVMAESISTRPRRGRAALRRGICRDVLKQMYVSRLGGSGARSADLPSARATEMAFDRPSRRLLLSLVDGHSSFEEVLDMSGMRRSTPCASLELLQQNVIKVAQPPPVPKLRPMGSSPRTVTK